MEDQVDVACVRAKLLLQWVGDLDHEEVGGFDYLVKDLRKSADDLNREGAEDCHYPVVEAVVSQHQGDVVDHWEKAIPEPVQLLFHSLAFHQLLVATKHRDLDHQVEVCWWGIFPSKLHEPLAPLALQQTVVHP